MMRRRRRVCEGEGHKGQKGPAGAYPRSKCTRTRHVEQRGGGGATLEHRSEWIGVVCAMVSTAPRGRGWRRDEGPLVQRVRTVPRA